jgi:hypothetical protein
MVTIQKTANVIRHATPTRIPSGWLSLIKDIPAKPPITAEVNPDTVARSIELISKAFAQQGCSPALALMNLAFLKVALVKFAPRISECEKFAPVRS